MIYNLLNQESLYEIVQVIIYFHIFCPDENGSWSCCVC